MLCLAMSNSARKAVFWGSDQVQHNWFIQSQKKTRSLKFRIYEAVGLHYLCRESKCTYQLSASLFLHRQKSYFLRQGKMECFDHVCFYWSFISTVNSNGHIGLVSYSSHTVPYKNSRRQLSSTKCIFLSLVTELLFLNQQKR